ncbi:MAG TPA: hypothetical protein VIF62_27115 [Labilithrix sp.]|jgi:hypothetical protein
MKLLYVFPFFAVVAACGGASQDDTGSSSSNLTQVDQVGIDAQVLQIWTQARVFPTTSPGGWFSPTAKDVKLDASSCPATSTRTSGSYEERDLDCSDAFSRLTPFDGDGKPGPRLSPILFTSERSLPNGPAYLDPDYCNTVELRLVVRDAASAQASFAGVGFYTSKGDSFTSKSDLQAVGHTRLKNGDDATVYRFDGISTCISSAHNSTSGNEFQTFAFKPYAAYDVDGTRYRVWENIRGNHTIGRSWPGEQPVVDATGFDRQHDLLAD